MPGTDRVPGAPIERSTAGGPERIIVGVTASASCASVIRRAAAVAARSGSELVGVHVDDGRQPPAARSALLTAHRRLLESSGGRFEQVVAGDVAAALVDYVQRADATDLVLGASTQGRIARLVRGSIVDDVLRRAHGVELHVVTSGGSTPSTPEERSAPRLPLRRRRVGWGVATAGTAALTAVLVGVRGMVGHGGHFPLYLLVVVLAALGGTGPAVSAAVLASFALNWFFTPPFHTWIIDDGENVLALAVFLVVGVLVGFLVTSLARWSDDARRGRAEAEALARVASEMVGLEDPLPLMLERIRLTLQLQGMAVCAEEGHVLAVAGDEPTAADPWRPAGSGRVQLRGELAPGDARVLDAFIAQLTATTERQALRRDAAQLEAVAAADRLRTALLRAVSHDLRTPLASIKASVTSLLQRDVDWSPDEQEEFLETIDEEVDRLDAVVGNLLDASRLEAGVIEPAVQRVALDEVVQGALASISGLRAQVVVDVPPELPTVRADRGLLERAIANLVANAVHASPPGAAVEISAIATGPDVRLRTAGPGSPRTSARLSSGRSSAWGIAVLGAGSAWAWPWRAA